MKNNDKIKEKDFYRLCEVIEEIGDVVNEYFPTVEELQAHSVEERIDKFLPLLVYYASDPFKNTNSDNNSLSDYQETVKYCKKILYNIELD